MSTNYVQSNTSEPCLSPTQSFYKRIPIVRRGSFSAENTSKLSNEEPNLKLSENVQPQHIVKRENLTLRYKKIPFAAPARPTTTEDPT